MDAADRILRPGEARVIPAIHVVGQGLCNLDEGSWLPESPFPRAPVGGVRVLHDVQPVVGKAGEKGLEGCPLVATDVATIVEHDVNSAHLVHDRSEERGVVLGTDAHLGFVVVKAGAIRSDVDAKDGGAGTEVRAPKFQRAALAHSYLQKAQGGTVTVEGKDATIDWEVMVILTDHTAALIVVVQSRELVRPIAVNFSHRPYEDRVTLGGAEDVDGARGQAAKYAFISQAMPLS